MNTFYDYTKFRPDGEVERVLRFTCERLGIDNITVVATCNNRLLDKLSRNGIDYQAVLFKSPSKNIYNLYFRSNLSKATFTEIICHEAVHLMQQERGDLSLNLTTGQCHWRGELFEADYPYMERPWEKEAFKGQAEILKAYRASQKAEKGGKQSGCLLVILFIIFLITTVSCML